MVKRLDLDTKAKLEYTEMQDQYSDLRKKRIPYSRKLTDSVGGENMQASHPAEINERHDSPSIFLELLQQAPVPKVNGVRNFGTKLTETQHKKYDELKKSSFKIESAELGAVEVNVIQNGSTVDLYFDLSDKARLPEHFLLLAKAVSSRLENQFDKKFSVKFK